MFSTESLGTKGRCAVRLLAGLLREEQGATAVEYAVMLSLILIVAISAISAFGGSTGGLWGGIESDLTSAGFGS